MSVRRIIASSSRRRYQVFHVHLRRLAHCSTDRSSRLAEFTSSEAGTGSLQIHASCNHLSPVLQIPSVHI